MEREEGKGKKSRRKTEPRNGRQRERKRAPSVSSRYEYTCAEDTSPPYLLSLSLSESPPSQYRVKRVLAGTRRLGAYGLSKGHAVRSRSIRAREILARVRRTMRNA